MHNQGVSDTISLDPYIYILVAFVTCFLSLLYSAAGIFSVPWDIIYLQKETVFQLGNWWDAGGTCFLLWFFPFLSEMGVLLHFKDSLF